MSRWWRVYDDAIDDPVLQMMPTREFVRKLKACFRGEQNEFSRYIKRARSRPISPEWKALRAEVFKRDDFTCTYCGARGCRLECDHILPASRGGTDHLDNLTTACFTCNRAKRDKTPEEWLQ